MLLNPVVRDAHMKDTVDSLFVPKQSVVTAVTQSRQLEKRDLLDLSLWRAAEVQSLLELAQQVKAKPHQFASALAQKTLLMLFEKPSLRTRLSFEVAMTQLGGHAIYYDITTSSLGKKETIEDTAKTASRYVDVIMARMYAHSHVVTLAQHADVPVINALTDSSHPCQVLSDLLTIYEKKGKIQGLKLAYVGDSNNNVTHSLLLGCALMGMHISVGCPPHEQFMPRSDVIQKSRDFASLSQGSVRLCHNAEDAVRDADFVYTDSWMSYHIPDIERQKRINMLLPFQVNQKLMTHAHPESIFLNCLPAMRGMEQTADVIDGPQSVVFDQAENRLHMQKALLLRLLSIA